MSTQQEDQAYRQQAAGDPERDEVLGLLAAFPWLLKQYYAGAIELLETEARLARRGLVIIAVLALCLASVVAGGWLVAIVFAAYLASAAGISPWAIGAAIILLHIVIIAALAQQLKVLAYYLLFPNSRRALRKLISSEQSPDL